MAEFVAIMLRGLQEAIVLFLLLVLFGPLISAIWAFIWPVLLLGGFIGMAVALDRLATRLEP